jgi:VCBS repeat-containing protein
MTPPTVAAGYGPHSVTVDPSGHFLYVANNHRAAVSQYTIGADGALSPMKPATVTAGGVPYSVVITETVR